MKSLNSSTRELRRQAKQRIEGLSVDRLRVANDFLAWLEERESSEATDELLGMPELLSEVAEAKRQLRRGRAVPWREVRDDV